MSGVAATASTAAAVRTGRRDSLSGPPWAPWSAASSTADATGPPGRSSARRAAPSSVARSTAAACAAAEPRLALREPRPGLALAFGRELLAEHGEDHQRAALHVGRLGAGVPVHRHVD